MADLAASAIALGGVVLGIYERVQGFLQRARVSDRFAQDLLNKLQQAQLLLDSVRDLAERCSARGPSGPDSRPESDSWSNILQALEYFEQYLKTLNRELEALGPTSNPTMLERALLQWRIDGRSEMIEKTKSELQNQMTIVGVSLNCVNIHLSTHIRELLLRRGSSPEQPPTPNGNQLWEQHEPPSTPSRHSSLPSISRQNTLVESASTPPTHLPARLSPILISAIKKRDKTQVQAWIDGRADLKAQDSCGWTPLHHAAHWGYRDILLILLKSRQSDIVAQDNAGLTPLHTAAMRGKERAGTLLIEYGAAINARDRSDRTPLILAVVYRKEAFVDMLLKRGANRDCGPHAKKFEDIVASL